ncbi:hypothetical protein [Streptosporangium vulgare]|uniref:hypothetical protein n=1 Tax=Streptosporangium vulgare TaxID=46190 RepID=UPI0031D6F869
MSAMLRDGYPLHGKYDCPGVLHVGDRPFNNFRGIGLGVLNLHMALVKSCDTDLLPGRRTSSGCATRAQSQGEDQGADGEHGACLRFGRPTGIDPAGESPGRIPDRACGRRALWAATKGGQLQAGQDRLSGGGKSSPSRAAFLKRLAYENCLEGFQWRPGDAATSPSGQGDVLVTPLQLAGGVRGAGRGRQAAQSQGGLGRWVRPDGTKVKEIKVPGWATADHAGGEGASTRGR